MRTLWSGFLLLAVIYGVSAQIIVDAGVEATAGEALSTREHLGATLKSDWLEFGAALASDSDGKYGADIANFRGKQSLFNNYLVLEEGFVKTSWGRMSVQAGRFSQADAFASPYSLFLSSNKASLMGAWYRYDDGRFTYENRWIELNHNSDFLTPEATPPAWRDAGVTGFPERGASLKTLTFRWGSQRWGLQDAAVYTGRSFDAEYFLSPLPSYFTQYVKGTAGRPWMTGANENNLIGVFWDWTEADFQVGAQVLVDDFSLYFLFPDQVPNNPWKVAWTFGGSIKTASGLWGLYQAGATRYTFAPYTSTLGAEGRTAYGYTLYPDVQYTVEGQLRGLTVEDNALGYLHGENNLALMVTHDLEVLPRLRWTNRLEGLLAGENSPANPWHDGTLALEYGTHLLDDPVVEKRLTLTTGLRWALGAGELYGTLTAGWVWNKLELRSPQGTWDGTVSSIDTEVAIYSPSSYCGPVAEFTVGGHFPFDLSNLLWGDVDG